MVLSAADARRLYRMIATRATRGQALLKRISSSAKVKNPGVAQLEKINKVMQETLGQLTTMANIITELSE